MAYRHTFLLLRGSLDFRTLYLYWLFRVSSKLVAPFGFELSKGVTTFLSFPHHETNSERPHQEVTAGKNMQKKNLLNMIVLVGLFLLNEAFSQIPSMGADLPSLKSLRWQMNMQEAKDSLKRYARIEVKSDSTLTYDDRFLNSNVKVKLQFTAVGSYQSLESVDATIQDKSLSEKILKYLIDRYGKPYDTHRKEESKLFITLIMEVKRWKLEKETVLLATLSRGEEIVSLNIAYKFLKQ